MKRTIVSIVSDQTIPNYIFIKEMFNIGDDLLFISSKKMENKIAHIVNTLNYVNCKIDSIVFEKNNDEESWNKMNQQISNKISKDKKYIVNLTGGTKFMSLAVQHIFEEYDCEFYYIPYPKNYILPLENENDKTIPIINRITVTEYMRLYNLKTGKKELIHSIDYTNYFFNFFVNDYLSDSDYEVIDKLRPYRDKKNIYVNEIENLEKDKETSKFKKVPNLQSFLNKISYPINDGKLSKYEIQYLTGGWFEEYIYNLVEKYINPDDIQIGVDIKRTNTTNMNDLDVVFTLGNKLFVIECKTGIARKSLLNEIVYKSSALKEYLLGLSANSYLFALTQEDSGSSQSAQNMGVKYIDRTYFTKKEKTQQLVNDIINKAY